MNTLLDTHTLVWWVDGSSTTRSSDPADRILVATARVLGATLVTSDSRIIPSKLVPTI